MSKSIQINRLSLAAVVLLVACAGTLLVTFGAASGQDVPARRITSPKSFSSSAPVISHREAAPEMRRDPKTLTPGGHEDGPQTVETLRAENNRLRLKLQTMEIDRLRAVHSAIPIEEANALRESIWANPIIEVNWENPGAAPAEERLWVREAVEATWQAVCGVEFVSWGTATPSGRGIHIKIEDVGPHCKGLGNKLDGRPEGMVLNFTFQNWCTTCAGMSNGQRKDAIKAIAAHEFGHALGFAHEQNRPEAPDWCQVERQGSLGDWFITIYDPESIMNYCSSEWNNAGQLSEYDKTAARAIYGPPRQLSRQ
jgi:hypothetical protein